MVSRKPIDLTTQDSWLQQGKMHQTRIQAGKQIQYKFLLHPLLSAEPDLNPATNGA